MMGRAFDHDHDGHKDFDFLHGNWSIQARKLAARFQDSTEWQEFEASSEVMSILDGVGNFEKLRATLPNGESLAGMTLRIFNPENRLWSLYWSDSHACQLFPPVVGRFRNGVGEFFGDDTEGGKAVKVRFTWTVLTPDSARWDQAMSLDDGQTWEHNWEMLHTRIGN